MRVSWIFDLEQGLLLTSCMKSCCGPCCCSSNLLEHPRPSSAICLHPSLLARPRDSNKPLVNWRVHLLFNVPSLKEAVPLVISPHLLILYVFLFCTESILLSALLSCVRIKCKPT
ncbi:uncharacterized protein LACBIDRAFT_306801 [Laccaria bicolor S238N-H82]|uniref:Predicted protein n=1 Tax=Laccaria bicolor (strain S238N-H82 / ATCC MYA-4686) TaxID=486041 RepID=B0DNR3_LACBS|nr:uncharacterized protein LACBIDRAFT_306801 [Laccaria bicolor S238N-H82]EDR03771.1 predicted protein [Laccaria bicolor S238N-H82]|eukprot:XP_001885624.1 predicted protein [Laccaria bicolor S238N-H82]